MFFNELLKCAVRNVFHDNMHLIIVVEGVVKVWKEWELPAIDKNVALSEYV